LLKTKTMRKSPEDQSFFDHYEELRNRLIKSIVAFFIASCLFYFVLDEVFEFLIKPVGQLVFIAPGEAFVARIMLTLLGGVISCSPCYFVPDLAVYCHWIKEK